MLDLWRDTEWVLGRHRTSSEVACKEELYIEDYYGMHGHIYKFNVNKKERKGGRGGHHPAWVIFFQLSASDFTGNATVALSMAAGLRVFVTSSVGLHTVYCEGPGTSMALNFEG